jgi:hypothetical protein
MKRSVLILILAVSVAIAGCSSVPGGGSPGGDGDSASGDEELQTSGDMVSSISVTATEDDMGQMVLRVNVEADAEGAPLSVTVSGPGDETVVGAVLSESDLLDGSETVGGILADNPPGGEYTVYIQEGAYGAEKDVVAEKSVSLKRGQPVIRDVSASGGEADMGEGYTVTDAEVVVSNSGDILLRISAIDVLSPSGDGGIPYTTEGTIEPGDTQRYATSESYNLPRFSGRQTTIEIVVRYGNGEQVSESITVTAE